MRKLEDWLDSFIDYGQVGEAPNHILFWSGVSAIAGALGRKCWLNQLTFNWFPNMYIIIVAPPGVVAKSTTAHLAIKLLEDVEGVNIGPNVTTWQALVSYFDGAIRNVDYGKGYVETASLTIESGELGNLIVPDDKVAMDMFNTLWDCGSIKKATKVDGVEKLERPFLNLIGCTTPSWISNSIPPYMIEGGLVSRIVWLYAEEKRRQVAYPGRLPADELKAHTTLRRYLIDDLNDIGRMEGQFTLTEDAYEWGTDWYNQHCTIHQKGMDDSRLGGFYSRKQSHVHKLAMVLSASRDASRIITLENLQKAEGYISRLEETLLQIFDRIGKTESSNVADRLLEYIIRAGEMGVTVDQCFLYIRGALPKLKDFDEVVKGLQRSRLVVPKVVSGQSVLVSRNK